MSRSIRLAAILLFVVAASASAQTPRLLSYARYETIQSATPRLVDTARFTYSSGRGCLLDSNKDFQFVFVRPDYSNLNSWYTHPHQPIAPRMVAQFDSLYTWRLVDSTSTLEPFQSARQFHSAQQLDSLVESRTGYSATSYRWLYNSLGQTTDSREWIFSGTSNQWMRTAGTHLIRNSTGNPGVKEAGQFDTAGNLTGIVTTYYQYDSLERLEVITISLGVNIRERLEYDILGRLTTWTGEEVDSNNNWVPILRDSFLYQPGNNRCSDIYSSTSDFMGGMVLNNHHIYTYDLNGQVSSYAAFGVNRTFIRNSDGILLRQTELATGGRLFETYYYYDSLSNTGLESVPGTAKSIEVYPNPADDRLFIRASDPVSSYKLYSIVGQEVQSGVLTGTETLLSLNLLRPGVYILSILFKDGKREARQVWKK